MMICQQKKNDTEIVSNFLIICNKLKYEKNVETLQHKSINSQVLKISEVSKCLYEYFFVMVKEHDWAICHLIQNYFFFEAQNPTKN